MTHDPLCPVSKNIATCLHCNGENNNTGRSNYCSDCWDNYVVIYPEPVPECQCDLIAKVRADERDSARERILETATYGPEFDRPVDDRTTAWMILDDVLGAIERGNLP